MRTLILIATCLCFISCKTSTNLKEEPINELETYYFKSINWTITVPEKWIVLYPKSTLQTPKGIIPDSTKQINPNPYYTELIRFKKDTAETYNSLSAIIEPIKIDNKSKGTLEEYAANTTALIKAHFEENEKKFEYNKKRKTINDRVFLINEWKLYTNAGDYSVTQSSYCTLVDDYFLTAVFFYKDDLHKSILQQSIENSKF